MRKYLSRNDCFLIVGILVVSFGLSVLLFVISKKGDVVCVYVDNTLFGEYSLAEDSEVIIKGHNLGVNHLVIRNGYASIEEANCKNQLCVNQRAISKNGETIVCLPNKVVCVVRANAVGEYDGISE